MLGVVHRLLLGMARLVEGATDHWLTPARRAEQDLSPEAYARFRDCAAPLDPDALWRAYRAAWEWGGEMLAALRARFGIVYSDDLLARITDAMS
jgi:lincosamide nucleotidyltransferase